MKPKQLLQKIPFSLIIGTGVPLVAALLLHAVNVKLIPVLLLVSVAIGFTAGRASSDGLVKKILTFFTAALYAAGALVILVYIMLIPFPLYQAWTILVLSGESSGAISLLFVTGIAYFSALFSSLTLTSGYLRPMCGLAAVVVFLVTIIYRDMNMCLLSLFLFLANAALAVTGQWKSSPRALLTIIFPLLTGAGLAIAFSWTGLDRAGYLSYRVLSPKVRSLLESAFPDARNLSRTPGYEEGESERELGGRAFLGGQPVCSLQAEPGRIVYLRMKVFDEYTGHNWRLGTDLIEETGREYVSLVRREPEKPDLTVTLLLDYSLLVPHTLDTVSFSLGEKQPVRMDYGSKHTGFRMALPLLKNSVVSLYEERERQPVPAAKGEERLWEHYSVLPATVPDSVRSLAVGFLAESSSVDDLTARILLYLSDNCRYTLKGGYPAEKKDFTEDFLFDTREGYCVHFATSAAVLFRLCGIPSRYVEGYRVRIPPDRDTVICTGLAHHAWTEIHVPGKGWMIVEATPPLVSTPESDPGYFERFNPDDDPLLMRQLEYFRSGEVSVREVNRKKIPWGFGWVLPVLAGLGLVAFLFRRLIKQASPRRVRYRGTKQRIRNLSVRLVRTGMGQGIPPPKHIGWKAWFLALQSVCGIRPLLVRRACRIVLATFYGTGPAGNRELAFVRAFYRKIRLGRIGTGP